MLGEAGESGGRRVDAFLRSLGDSKAYWMQDSKVHTGDTVSVVSGPCMSVEYSEDFGDF